MTTEITYLGNLKTEVRHDRSGAVVYTDAPPDNRGQGSSFSPTDLVCMSLGTCILTIMGIRAMDNQFSILGARATVEKTMAEQPRRITRLHVRVFLPPGDYSTRQRKVLEAAAHGCPVSQSLSPDLEEIIELIWP